MELTSYLWVIVVLIDLYQKKNEVVKIVVVITEIVKLINVIYVK